MHFFLIQNNCKIYKRAGPTPKNVINIIFLEWDRLGFGCRERYWWGLFVDFVEVALDFFVGEIVVDEVAGEVFVVGCHVDEAVAR